MHLSIWQVRLIYAPDMIKISSFKIKESVQGIFNELMLQSAETGAFCKRDLHEKMRLHHAA